MSDRGNGKTSVLRRSARYTPLPLRTFGDIVAHGLEVQVSGRQGQRFAGARFRCRCGGFGCPSIRPPVPVQFAPGDMIADLYCGGCVPPWEIRDVRLDPPPWSTLSRDAFLFPRCLGPGLLYQPASVAD